MRLLTTAMLDELCTRARQAPRLRAHLNLHEELADPVQRLAIAVEPGSYVRAHRHPQSWELFTCLRGRFSVLNFDERGVVVARTELGSGVTSVETPAGCFHALAALEPGSVFLEVKKGPYIPPSENDIAAWAPAEGAHDSEHVRWIERAQIGARAWDNL